MTYRHIDISPWALLEILGASITAVAAAMAYGPAAGLTVVGMYVIVFAAMNEEP